MAACMLPLGACSSEELGDGAALPWCTHPWEVVQRVLDVGAAGLIPFGVFCSIPSRVAPPEWSRTGSLGASSVVGAGSSALGIKGQTASWHL